MSRASESKGQAQARREDLDASRTQRRELNAPARQEAPTSTRLTVDQLSVADTAPALQLKAFDDAVTQVHQSVAHANHELYGDAALRTSTANVQMESAGPSNQGASGIHAAAERGTRGGGGQLPFFDKIQASFGGHDISSIQSHTGAEAREANRAIGSMAYASGNHVAFKNSPDLFTAAHEAAHVVQQRAGVSLRDGVGQSGDRYEQHADEVASRVVQGQSAEDLLGRFSGASSAGGVQKRADREGAVSKHSGSAQGFFGRFVQFEKEGEGAATADVAAAASKADPAPAAAPAPNAIRDADQPYTTVRGDTLYGLAGRVYQKPNLWPAIYQRNRAALGADPNRIGVGVAITIPSLESIIATSTSTNHVLWAFEAYWNVSSSRVDGARRWDPEVIRHIHQQMKSLPDQDTRNGVWQGLQLTNSADLRDRAAWDGTNFIVGQNADTKSTIAMGHGTILTDEATPGATEIEVEEPYRFKEKETVAIDRKDAALKDTAKITSIAGNTYKLDSALAHKHEFGAEVTPDDDTAVREVNWLAATVRHEIAHAVETSLGGVTGFTQGLGGWWVGTGDANAADFDTWAAAMSDPWGASRGVVLTQDEKNQIRDAIVDAVKNRTQDLENSVADDHPLKREFYRGVGVIDAASACLSLGDNFFQAPTNFHASNGKKFTVSFWYKTFMYHNDSIVADRVSNYSLYAPAEFFAETYTMYYEEAAPGVPEAQYGRLIRNGAWRDWIKTNIHERNHAPAGGGGGSPAPSGASVGKRSGNPGR